MAWSLVECHRSRMARTDFCVSLLELSPVSGNVRLPAVTYGRAQTGYLCQMDLTLNPKTLGLIVRTWEGPSSKWAYEEA